MDILYWADGTWIYYDEYDSIIYSWKSDDFGRVAVHVDASDAEIDEIVKSLIY
jgi:hypothetical protein